MNKPVDTHLALADARRLTQRVHFERDGTVTIASGKVDLGQGISTALAQIAAEELGVELSKVRILPASTAYSPDEGVTSGSLSIQDGGKGLRKACAELRELLKRSGKRSCWELARKTPSKRRRSCARRPSGATGRRCRKTCTAG